MGIGPDFLLVQLTPAGVAFAKGGPLRSSNGRISMTFTPGVPVKAARFEWDMLLKDHCTPDGQPLFEICTAPPESQAASAKENV
jgi:hypothetical protein